MFHVFYSIYVHCPTKGLPIGRGGTDEGERSVPSLTSPIMLHHERDNVVSIGEMGKIHGRLVHRE